MSNRLEEIKEHIAWTVDNGLVPRLDDSDLAWLIERVEELESTLQFYADPINYDSRHGLEIFKDCGEKARRTLNDL